MLRVFATAEGRGGTMYTVTMTMQLEDGSVVPQPVEPPGGSPQEPSPIDHMSNAFQMYVKVVAIIGMVLFALNR
eukprot:scaffold996_cov409-Prasinococcus_capsulatus_cf.AAC.15